VKPSGTLLFLASSLPAAPLGQGENPRSPPAIRPERWLVVDPGGPPQPAMDAFVCKYLLDRESPTPTPGSAGPLGDARWTEATMPEHGELGGELGFAFTTVHSDHDDVRMARLPGAGALFVEGEGYVGDPERRGFQGVPVHLRAGENRIFVAGIRGGFELELRKPATRMVIGAWDFSCPWMSRGDKFDRDGALAVPIFNASTSPAKSLHYLYGHAQPDDGHAAPIANERRDGGSIAPLCFDVRSSYLFGGLEFDDQDRIPCEWDQVLVPLAARDEEDADADRRVIRLKVGELHSRAGVEPSWTDADANSDTFLVYGTIGSEEDWATSLALARYFQQRLWYWSKICPQVVSDEEFLNPAKHGLDESRGNAIVLGSPRTNAVVGWSWSSAPSPPATDEPARLEVSAPPRSDAKRVKPPFGTWSAPDARTMRLLYAVDPFFALKAGERRAAFEADPKTKAGIVRRW